MKLANRAYLATLILLMLAFAVPAQKSEKEDRNTAPTVGTGGAVGGPTGLFTVYDSSTLRKGEYTLSAALSNYDRDPGNVDISSVPLSFQVGLSNRFELFFTTESYRGVKVNSPQNLSGFYLPNSTLLINGVNRRPAAIVLEPGAGGRAVFRPLNAPFASFPYTGALFYIPTITTTPTLGPPRAGGASALFPGVGSVYGGILPGIVLTTTTIANGASAPASFSSVPNYLADAPFLNRTWGQSAFNDMTFGFKWRFNDSMAAWGHGISMFYRYYPDTASGFAGFNQMQRGAGRGSNKGDLGVTYFIDARATKWANVSFNAGYVYTSKVTGTFGGTDFVMHDPGDEFTYSVGVDFPVNKHFQPILEFRSLNYVGGRTPNGMEQDPMDGVAGFRVYPRRWFGFGLAYRHNFNQQDFKSFSDVSSSSSVTVLCGPVPLAGCVPTTVTSNVTGPPSGIGLSNDPHGYIGQFWIGRRDKRRGEIENKPANVDSVTLGAAVITLPCRPGFTSRSGACRDGGKTISVATRASDPENDVLTYNYTVSGGRVVGTGANVTWDLSNAQAGTYTITTGVDDGCGICGKTDTKTIRVEECADCVPPAPDCPTCSGVSISGPAGITSPGSNMTFTATASGATSYNWTVSRGTIVSGQGTPSITVSTTEADAGQTVTATLEVAFGDRPANCGACPTTASETAGVASKPTPNIVDEFGKATDDDVKARVDNFYIQLNNNPSAQGYIINYGTPAQVKKRRAQIMKAINFRKYDVSRVTFVDGPDNGTGESTKFYTVPAGADRPNP